MWTLALALACGNPSGSAPEPTASRADPSPAAQPAPEPPLAEPFAECVAACERMRMAEAAPADVIRARCEQECARAVTVVRQQSDIADHTGERVTVRGVIARRPLRVSDAQGTAIVLDDDTPVWVTYGDPPHGWEGLLGERVDVVGDVYTGPPGNFDRAGISLAEPHLLNFDAPVPVSVPDGAPPTLEGPPAPR